MSRGTQSGRMANQGTHRSLIDFHWEVLVSPHEEEDINGWMVGWTDKQIHSGDLDADVVVCSTRYRVIELKVLGSRSCAYNLL